MPQAKFIGFWSKDWQAKYRVPKGFLLIKPKDEYKKDLGVSLNKLVEYQSKKGELRELDVTIEYHYKKRTLNMNNLMWALYDIEAVILNAGMGGHKEQMITPSQLYEQDVEDYAPRIEAKIKEEKLELLQRMYNRVKIKERVGGLMILNVILGTSHFDTKQMSIWIDRQFNRIAYHGVPLENGMEIKDFWRKWRQELNDKHIVLHDHILTQEEYKNLNPICEATGEYVGDESGDLCHINARGMGGNEEPWKNYASNWLHLKSEAHRFQHDKGWGEFLRKYPHLRFKVETALKREYEEIPGWQEEPELDIF